MALGGKRPGAGRPKGSRNRRTAELVEAAQKSGILPLDFLLSVMRDKNAPRDVRIEAAKAAAPYLHARLNSVNVNAKVDGPAPRVVMNFGGRPKETN
jgi:hypothetical protein